MSELPHPIIERMIVKNYRSLVDVEVDLGPLAVFVGPNGSGKSTIVDVLRFVRDALLARGLETAIPSRHGLPALRAWSRQGRDHEVQIQIYVRGPDWKGDYGFSLVEEPSDEYRVSWEKLSVHDERTITFEHRDGQWIEFPVQEPLAGLRDIMTPLKTALMLPSLSWITPSIDRLYQFMAGMAFYTIYPNTLRTPQRPAHSYPLDELGWNLASVLRGLKREYGASAQLLIEALGRAVEGVYDYSVDLVGGYLVTRLHHIGPKDNGPGPIFELAQESDGTLRMLGLLTALYQYPPPPHLAIEEPELTIHPGALGVVSDVLWEASLRSQVMITTHNPDLVDRFSTDMLRVVDKEAGVTKVGPVAESQRQAIIEMLFSPGELMRIEGLYRDSPAAAAI